MAASALALCGCGGGGAHRATTQQTAAAKVQVAHWSAGLRRWGAGMRGAIDGLSLLFSRPADVQAIQAGSARTDAALARYEGALAACSDRVENLGAAPAGYEPARAAALGACTSLERGASLVRRGVKQLQHGLGSDLISASSDPLGFGQDGIRRALLELAADASRVSSSG